MSSLALGTAQFGLHYGIANQKGKVSLENIKAMLQLSRSSGIDTLDTAIAYGDSEDCLGKAGIKNFKVVTKLPAVPIDCTDIKNWVQDQINASLARLQVEKVYGLLLHTPNQLLKSCGQILYDSLKDLKKSGLVQKIGISIYSPAELDAIISKYRLDLIQIPFNLIDRRLYTTGWLQHLKSMDIEIHSRSVFLQGLLLMPKEKIPTKFRVWSNLWDKWYDWLSLNQISAIKACLMFPFSFPEIDRVIVGTDNIEQLEQIIEATRDNSTIDFPNLSSDSEELINPTYWPKICC